MTNIVEGLDAIQARLDEVEKKFADKGPKTEFFSLRDGEASKFVFAQEIDKASPHYSEKNGVAALAVEHVHPEHFRTHGLCTIVTEGSCYGCEQHEKDFKAGWAPKDKIYVNVIVETPDGWAVKVMSQSVNKKAVVGPAILEQARELGSITDRFFKMKRSGSGQYDTSYTFTALKEHDLDVETFELFDLRNKVLRAPSYEEQPEFYERWRQWEKDKPSGLEEFAPKTAPAKVDEEW